MQYPSTVEERTFNAASFAKVSMKPVTEISMCVPPDKSEPYVFANGRLVGSATKIRQLLDYWEGKTSPSAEEVDAMFSLQ